MRLSAHSFQFCVREPHFAMYTTIRVSVSRFVGIRPEIELCIDCSSRHLFWLSNVLCPSIAYTVYGMVKCVRFPFSITACQAHNKNCLLEIEL